MLVLIVGFNWLEMDPEQELHENEIFPKVNEDAYFDKNRFLSAKSA